jgi:succinate dehydrogenase / fumarate reductase cytochrome b subunit
MSYSSLARKFLMAITGLFLISFLVIHLAVNLLLLSSDPTYFNAASHFMATNWIIQVMQYVLALGFIVHIGLGIKLEMANRKARPVKYAKDNPSENSSASSRSMIYTGLLVLLFLLLHLYDYFYKMKFVGVADDYQLVVELFDSWFYTLIYVISFILLGIHLNHGFQSSFQSVGANHRMYTPMIKKLGSAFSLAMTVGFSLIAIYHFIF